MSEYWTKRALVVDVRYRSIKRGAAGHSYHKPMCRTDIKFPTFCPHTLDGFFCWMLLGELEGEGKGNAPILMLYGSFLRYVVHWVKHLTGSLE